MILLTDLGSLAYGHAVCLTDNDGWTTLLRFTARQLTAYEKTPQFTAFSRQTAGIGLRFLTDGDEIRFFCRLAPRIDLIKAFASTTPEWIAQIKNGRERAVSYNHDRVVKRIWLRNSVRSAISMNVFELLIDGRSVALVKAIKGEIIITFDNPDRKTHQVDLLFPLLEGVAIKDFSVSGTVEQLIESRPRMLCLGDSITQGCLAAHPAQTYVRQLADRLNYEAINQGIAGCRYLPEHLAGIEDIPEPRLITVAYGTNDWDSLLTRSEIQANIRAYYQQLHDKFPGKPIYVITPIWRADMNEPRPSGDFSVIRRIIEAEAAQWQNMSVIDGLSISPHEEAFFGDIYLHPNDRGFTYIADNLADRFGKNHPAAPA